MLETDLENVKTEFSTTFYSVLQRNVLWRAAECKYVAKTRVKEVGTVGGLNCSLEQIRMSGPQ